MEKYPLKSMTAYGRGNSIFPYGRFLVEIQSVNRRFLEININLPRFLTRFENELRKRIANTIGRGTLNLYISFKAEGALPIAIFPNIPLAHALKEAWEKLKEELNLEESLPISLLAQEKDLFIFEDELKNEDAYRRALQLALDEALGSLLSMKREEGQRLAEDLHNRISFLRGEISKIQESGQEAPEKYRQKLHARLEELLSGSSHNDERILREIAIYTERIDITEEIVRFKSHLDQMEHTLLKPQENELEVRGKTLDFILQELNRETNTLGSKASDLTVSKHVVTIKTELEKIREQVQNLE
jgi:uncharacterized protein (TIGR00255 family)